ncbi:MAG: cytochrome c oxidase subunit II [Halopseudomonas sp.]|uniref:cytochrome c oxidase subunit II n=1 Tax=Halopseudomonas sp. TaxID=2901191 RepID=UPI0030014BAE
MTENSPAIVDADVGFRLIPEQASAHAAEVDHLYYALMGLSGVLVLVLVGLIVGFTWRYHHHSRRPRGPAVAERTSHRIEIVFACGLLLFFFGVFAWAGQLYLQLYRDSPADLTINVVGKQWMWKVYHPDGTREINTLHAPIGERIRLRLTSEDVIHSLSVPALRLKRDAVPGMYTSAYFTASKAGEYRLFCAEFCGDAHSRMRGRVILMPPDDYQAWLRRNGSEAGPAEEGKALFSSYGCSGCHRTAPQAPAPALDGIYGRVVPLADGSTLVADEAYLHDAIVAPQKHVVAGFQPIMPSYAGQISESEIIQLIAYLRSLKAGDWRRESATEAE